MATIAHISHYGLTQLSDAGTMIRFEGTVGNCKRLAAAHGLEWTATHQFSHLSNRQFDRWYLTLNGKQVGCIMDMRCTEKCVDQYQVAIERYIWETE